MNVSVSITLQQGDKFDQTMTEAAHAVLEALGGDASRDTCQLMVNTVAAMVGPSPDNPTPPDVSVSPASYEGSLPTP